MPETIERESAARRGRPRGPSRKPDLDGALLAGFATIEVVATQLGKAPRTVRRWVEDGRLPSMKIGNTRLISIEAVRAKLMASATASLKPARARAANKRRSA